MSGKAEREGWREEIREKRRHKGREREIMG